MNGINSLDRRAIFVGEHELTIDDKNRLLIPAQFRKKIVPERDGSSLFVTLKEVSAYGRIPWFYAEKFYCSLVDQHAPPELTPTEDESEYTYLKMSMADELEWDSQGRVVLPEKILRDAELGKEVKDVILVGAKDHMELWHRPRWSEFRKKLIKKSAEIESKARQNIRRNRPEIGKSNQASDGNGEMQSKVFDLGLVAWHYG
jgi:MraZ protein